MHCWYPYGVDDHCTEAVGIDEATADAAIAYAIGKDWLIGGGSQPHSICLTDAGRVWTARLVK